MPFSENRKLRAARGLSFRFSEKGISKFCDFMTSIAAICVCGASDRATQSINIRSAHSIVHKSTLAHRCVLRVVSAFGSQKKAYQSFVTSRLQSRRFACALSRIAQRKSINTRSAHSRVHKSTLAHRYVLRVVSAFGFQKKAYQSFVTSRLQSRRFACAVPREGAFE